jgi:hypothetical protein
LIFIAKINPAVSQAQEAERHDRDQARARFPQGPFRLPCFEVYAAFERFLRTKVLFPQRTGACELHYLLAQKINFEMHNFSFEV